MDREKRMNETLNKIKEKFENVQKVIKSKVSDDDIIGFIIIYLAANRKADKELYDLIIALSAVINIRFTED